MSDQARGVFVVLEGPEGAGKSVQIERLSEFLTERAVPHVTTREPGGTATAEAIREVILDRPELGLDGMSELLLFSASRHVHVEEVIRPALARGDVVLCDRFELSTRAYQGYGRGVPQETIRRVTLEATGGLRPDLYLVLDVAVSVGRDRQRGSGSTPDRIEREKPGFMERVRVGYRELVAEGDRIELVDASRTPEEVQRALVEVLAQRFPGVFGDSAPVA